MCDFFTVALNYVCFLQDNKSVHKEEALHSNFQSAQETKRGSIFFSDLLNFVSDIP